MKVGELGEFGLIESLRRIIERAGVGVGLRREGILGIGDDAAAWRAGKRTQLGTTDTLVEGIHFTRETASWRDLGWKSLAVNLSDIAAMGGDPAVALVSLSLPAETDAACVEALYEGMAECALAFRTAILGGNVSEAPLIVITVSLVGEVEEGRMLTRSAAKPGDAIAVTGYLGASAAGLRMLKERLDLAPDVGSSLRMAHLRPSPRVVEGVWMARHGVRAAIDISDGLLADLGHVCRASAVGAQIRLADVPVHPAARRAFGDRSLEMALSGGEDYELLFTAPLPVIERARQDISVPVTIVGSITGETERIVLVDESGKEVRRGRGGWEHFGGWKA